MKCDNCGEKTSDSVGVKRGDKTEMWCGFCAPFSTKCVVCNDQISKYDSFQIEHGDDEIVFVDDECLVTWAARKTTRAA